MASGVQGPAAGADRALMDTAAVALRVQALSVRFGGLVAIEAMTLDVREGEVVSLIGPNGAGKTTAFNAITGYLPPAGGEILYRGQRLNGLKPNRIAALGADLALGHVRPPPTGVRVRRSRSSTERPGTRV